MFLQIPPDLVRYTTKRLVAHNDRICRESGGLCTAAMDTSRH
jgi:hypothetical protein